MARSTTPRPDLPITEPAATLVSRLREELAADFPPHRPTRITQAPGRLDVMGGIADYTGSLVCEMTLDRIAAVAMQARDDRQLQVFSFNLFDEHKPFTLRIPLDALAKQSESALRREFAEPGRKWAAYLAGCLWALHDQKLIDLADPRIPGLSLALYSTVPLGAGVSSSAAIEVAAMMNFIEQFGLRDRVDPMRVAELCQLAENRIVGSPCGIMDQVTSCAGQKGRLLRMICQPHELQPPLELPEGIRVLGINSNVKHDIGGPSYARTRCAAFMGHRLILEHMREQGAARGYELVADPTHGYLANLDPDHYKNLFRAAIPERMRGGTFLDRYGPTIDPVTTIDPDQEYAVRRATDHHVLEARRVRRFVEFLEQARDLTGPARGPILDRAGHLMYGSHQSYTDDALLGAPECDLLVKLIRDRESEGFYGAKITGGGSGGTVAVLANNSDRAIAGVEDVMREYERQTGLKAEVFAGSGGEGAWGRGVVVI
jgi:galactokinase